MDLVYRNPSLKQQLVSTARFGSDKETRAKERGPFFSLRISISAHSIFGSPFAVIVETLVRI